MVITYNINNKYYIFNIIKLNIVICMKATGETFIFKKSAEEVRCKKH